MARKDGDLQVWWIPQIPGKAFTVPVATVQEGAKLLIVLAEYDDFQFKNRIKGDYSNAGGLQRWFDGDWEEWDDPETGDDIDSYMQAQDELVAKGKDT